MDIRYKISLWIIIIVIILWIIINRFKSIFVGGALLKEETLSKDEETFLILVSKYGGVECFAETIVPQGMSIEKGKYYLVELYRKGFVSALYGAEYGAEYSITQKGREYLIDNKMM